MKRLSQHQPTGLSAVMEVFCMGTVHFGSHQPHVAIEQLKCVTEELNLIVI